MIKTSEEELRKSFSQYGTIIDINLKTKNAGILFAFVEFDSISSAQKSI
jgi:RNA recognition motif-containing protein